MKTTIIILSMMLVAVFNIAGCGDDTVTGKTSSSNVVYESAEIINYKDTVNDTLTLWSGAVNPNDTYNISMGVFLNDTNLTSWLSWGIPGSPAGDGVVICDGGNFPQTINVNASMSGQMWQLHNCHFRLFFGWRDGIVDPTKWIKLTSVKIYKAN